MAKALLEKCCFCIDLRVGCFVIGYLNLIVSALATIAAIILMATGIVLTTSDDQGQKTIGVAALVMGIITISIVALSLIFSIVLVLGLHKHKPGLVKAYITYSSIFLVISLILIVVSLVVGPYVGGIILSRLLGVLFTAYCIIVIRSYYYQMLEKTADPPHYKA